MNEESRIKIEYLIAGFILMTLAFILYVVFFTKILFPDKPDCIYTDKGSFAVYHGEVIPCMK